MPFPSGNSSIGRGWCDKGEAGFARLIIPLPKLQSQINFEHTVQWGRLGFFRNLLIVMALLGYDPGRLFSDQTGLKRALE